MIGPRGLINPLNDYAFLKTLGEKGADKPLRNLVNAVLNEAKQPTLSALTINTRHFNASDIDGDKSCVLDVTASAKQGKVNVEVQIVNNGDIELRLLFYWAKLFTAKFKKGQNYKTLNNVISIAILDYVIDEDNPDFLSHFQIKNTKNGKLFSNALNIFVIEMPKFRALKFKDINNPLHQWLLFLDENTEQNIINKLIDMNTNIK
jgi:predicted transposase/invertase (TIGR01784 family)